MKLSDIANIRLTSQQIAKTKFEKAKDIVHWMGAIQAQDYAMAKWAIGVRLPGSTDKLIETAIDQGEIIRTHILRPTWHFVSADDIYWMLELTAPQIKSSLKSRHKELGLSETILTKSNAVIEKALDGDRHITREELRNELTKAKIPTDNNRASHLLLQAELDGIICSGAIKDNKQTYTLLEKRVPKRKTLHKEEALAKLAEKYFLSHCPATLQDFIWWSGLSASDARLGLEMNKPAFISETIDAQTYWLPYSFSIPKIDDKSVHLLPAFDEFIISYKNRSVILNIENHKKAVSSNGIFRPVIVVNGQVTGLWKRTIKKGKVAMETAFFRPHSKTELNFIEKVSGTFGNFLGRITEIKHNTPQSV